MNYVFRNSRLVSEIFVRLFRQMLRNDEITQKLSSPKRPMSLDF